MPATSGYCTRKGVAAWRSRAVMERLGMRHAGEFLRPGLVEGRDGVHGAAPFALYVARGQAGGGR